MFDLYLYTIDYSNNSIPNFTKEDVQIVKYIDDQSSIYDPNILSTSQSGINVKEVVLNMEINEIKKLIKEKFDVNVTDYWIPDEGSSEKYTILVECDLSDEMKHNYEKLSEFEYILYSELSDFLKKSINFEMIGLLG